MMLQVTKRKNSDPTFDPKTIVPHLTSPKIEGNGQG